MAIGIGIGLTFGRRKGIDAQAQAAFNSLQSAGFTTPQGITGINAAFKTIKTIYGTSDITTAISFFGDPSLAYQIGAGSGTTLGQAIRTLPNIIDPTRATDAVQTTAASQPLLLVHEGANYYWNSGESSNSLQTPSSAANQITGTVDFDFGFEILPSGNFTQGFGKVQGNASGPSYACFIGSGGSVNYIDSLGSYTSIVNISSFAPSAGNLFYVRLTLSGTTATCFTSLDGTNWTSRGTATVAPLVTSNSSPITFSAGSFTGVQSKGYRLRIYNGLRNSGGTLAVDCNPNQYNPSTSQTQWTSSTGEVWTINKGTTAGQFTGQLVYRTQIGFGGDAQAKSFSPNINVQVNQPDTIYIAYKFDIFSVFQGLIDSNTASTRQTITNFNASGSIEISAGTSLPRTGLSQSAISLLTGVYNGANSSIQINNGAQTIGNANTQRMDGLRIGVLANSPPNFSLNGNIYSLVIAKQVDNTTQRTAMYNYIRSINNNAF